MTLNEINLEKACPICGAEYDPVNNQFIVRCGPTISATEFAGKVCFFAKKRNAVGCINDSNNDNPSWESYQGLDLKSENTLNNIGVNKQNIDYLKLHGSKRF